MTKISYDGYRFPREIIQHAIWLYYRFTLSFRDVEDLLAYLAGNTLTDCPLIPQIVQKCTMFGETAGLMRVARIGAGMLLVATAPVPIVFALPSLSRCELVRTRPLDI